VLLLLQNNNILIEKISFIRNSVLFQ